MSAVRALRSGRVLVTSRVKRSARRNDETEIRNRIGVLNRLGIDERVRSNDGTDGQPKQSPEGGRFPCRAGRKRQPDEHDAGGDGEHPDGGAQRHVLIQCNSAENEDHDRGRPTSDRIDDAELAASVGAGEQNEVHELERRRRGYERHRLRRNAAGDHAGTAKQRHARRSEHPLSTPPYPATQPAARSIRHGEPQRPAPRRARRRSVRSAAAPSSTPSPEPRCRAAARPASPPRGTPTRRSPPRCRGRRRPRGCPRRAWP